MLNRRSLRIKAAQNLYALYQRKLANYELAYDYIKAKFEYGFDTPEGQTREDVNAIRKRAVKLLEMKIQNSATYEKEIISPEIKESIDESIKIFSKNYAKDKSYLSKNLIIEAEEISNKYLLILNLLVVFSDFSSGEKFRKTEKYRNNNFLSNSLIDVIRKNKELEQLTIRNQANWDAEYDLVRSWYKDLVSKSEEFKAYGEIASPTEEEERAICNFIIKSIVFKNKVVNAHFEALDIAWEENKTVIKSMVLKSIKSLVSSDNDSLEVSQLSYNWEDDKSFFKQLFESSVEKEEEFELLVAEKSKNWDIHRLAVMDKIILKMAICEMIIFPSIPVKVTINEYIEISKRYSTPKSKQFVNGLLDSLANKLTAEGIIKKSGRGLIDNK